INNPHIIVPGEMVYLVSAERRSLMAQSGDAATAATAASLDVRSGDSAANASAGGGGATAGAVPGDASTVSLRQLAFVSIEDLAWAGTLAGAPEERVMLSEHDEVYIDYPAGQPPQVGRRYAIYSPTKDIVNPQTKQKIGAYVVLYGEVEIESVKKGKRALGLITYGTEVIERGLRVGPVKTQFKQVPPVAAKLDLEGAIVAVIESRELISEGQVVFIDKGANDGVKVGNRFRVVRRGDAYNPILGPRGVAASDDMRFPEDNMATISVVETTNGVSIGLVSAAAREVDVGDHAVLRRGR
ncbi:MAG: hypothetical protein V2A73_08305, partial [Pseudomonadota bacterium]